MSLSTTYYKCFLARFSQLSRLIAAVIRWWEILKLKGIFIGRQFLPLLVIIPILLLPVVAFSQTKTYTAGAYIIDMGQSNQTIANGLKPYGLVYALLKSTIPVPVDWSINSAKAKDGKDFTVNSKDYKGGPFIIPSELITPAVLTLITTWRAAGVIVEGPIPVGFTAPLYKTLSKWPRAFLDLENDDKITPYYDNAGIPSGSYVINANPTMLPQCGSPTGDMDVYILPHADPDLWDATWITALLNFINNGGAMWAGCHAVSVMENLPGCNFLSNGGLIPFGSHGDGTPPYTYISLGNPLMQFIGILDAATQNGSEQIYVPGALGWRATTTISVYDPNYVNAAITYPNTAAIIAFGPAFGSKGLIMYEAGHRLDQSGNIAAQVAAQRAYFDFLLNAGTQTQLMIIPPDISNQNVSACTGIAFTASPAGAPANTTYTWSAPTGTGFTGGSAQATQQTFISQTLNNITSNPVTAIYTVTPQIGGCIGHTFTLTVTVNPLPTISVTPSSASICLGRSTLLTASGATSYNWSPSTGLSSTTGATVTANPTTTTTYTVTGTNSNGCSNTTTVSITINPTPTATGVTICQGGSASSLTSSSTCPNGSAIAFGPANAGTGINVAGVGTVAWTNPGNAITNNGVYATVTLSGPGTKTSNYLRTSNYNFSTIPANATIAGITVLIGRFENTGSGASTNMRDAGLKLIKAGSITGDDKANTSTDWPTSLTTATYGGTSDLWGTTWTCSDINALNFGVSLTVSSSNDRTASVDYIQISITYTVPGSLNWYTVSSGGSSIGTGSPFNPVGVAGSGLPNTNTADTYPFYAECSSVPGCRTLTNYVINPKPSISAISSSICSGTAFSVTPVNVTNGVVPAGTTYTWGTPVYSPAGSISGGSAQTDQLSISQTLTNSTNSQATATYTVTPTSGTPALCVGSSFTVTVTVNPIPAMSGVLNPSAICSNTLFSYTPSSGTSGSTFTWNRATITGISPVGPTTGVGSINETLVNSTNNPVVVTYAYSLAANSCSNTQNVSVVVIPPANVIASTLPATICLGASTSLTSSSNFLTLPTTILNQNFNSSPAEWTSSNLSLGNNPTLSSWSLQPNGYSYTDEVPTTVTFHSNDNTQFYLSNSRAQGPQVGPPNPYTDTYLTSPMVNISGYSSLTLDFYHCFTYATTNEGTGSLEISTNGKDWNVIETYSSSQGTSGSFAHRTISLSSYIGNQILQIRFHYNTPARARQWAIDNLSLTGTPPQPTISWTSIPSGFSSANANPGTVNPAVTTVYTATYTDPSTNCSGSDTAKVIVNPLPVPTITGPASACLNSAGNVYTTESGKTNYSWTVNGGTITAGGGSANNSVTVTWNNSGTNSLSVNYTDSNGCTATSPTTFAVTVNGLPTITTAANAPGVCFGNGIQTTSLIYSATTGSPTTYSINWNTSPLNSFATVNDVTLTSSPLIITVPANTAAGTYTGTITVKNANGCVSLGNTFSINVNPLPVITVQPADQLDCEGLIVSFHVVATGSGLTYTWQRKKPSGTFTDIPVEPNVTYPSQGTIRLENVGNSDAPDGTQYRVIITNSDNCSITSSIATLYVNEITGINPISTNVTICQGQNYSYQVTTNHPSNVVSYQWKKWNNPGQWDYVIDGGPISGSTTDHLVFTGATPSESGKYKVTVVFHSSGADCNVTSDTRDRTLNVNPTPSCSITGSGSVYVGSTGNIFTSSPNPSDNVIHLWSISGNGTISGSKTGSTVNVDATTVGSFMLTDNISRYGCTSSCTYDVSVIDLPCSITPTTSVTNGTSTTYIAPAGMDSYAWSIAGNGSIPSAIKNQQTITVLAGNSCNTYTLTVTITKSGASSTCTQTIVVTDNIPPTFTLPNTFSECVENLYAATYYGATMDINPDRPEYYTFSHGDPRLDLNTSNLTDNCNLMNCLPVQIHWQIVFSPTPDPLPPHNPVTKSPVTGTGQPSEIVGSIQFPGDGVTFNNTVHTITYWIKDCAGNESLPQSQTITIRPRPNIIKGN